MPTPVYLASNTIVTPNFYNSISAYGAAPSPMIPVAGCCAWMVGHAAPGTISSSLLRIDSLTGAGHRAILCQGATSLRLCLRYDPSSAQTITGPPIVQVVGVDVNGVPELLQDANGATEFTLTASALADLASGASAYFTAPVEVDLQNSLYAYVLIKQAATGTAFTDADAAVMVKLK